MQLSAFYYCLCRLLICRWRYRFIVFFKVSANHLFIPIFPFKSFVMGRLNGCSAIALASKDYLTWAHFPSIYFEQDTTYIDTWKHFLSEIESQAWSVGILDL
ncbi:unnamed protein product [Periconia digitata]|uniref:Uncharacterized protein n=1 Tax=Periconia digitata TaxID=1303443 RepID=A0A9W4UTY7_9PLEO|nr:unnamed protein product [Periconia digitata]